jgi:transcriptional regulator with XRE-family HTH domain
MHDRLILDRMAKMVADNVRRLRKARDWTQDDLATRVGLSRGAIGQIERGEVDPALSTAQAIADVFGTPIGELTGEVPETAGLSRDALQIGRHYDDLSVEEKAFAQKVWRRFFGEPPSSQ